MTWRSALRQYIAIWLEISPIKIHRDLEIAPTEMRHDLEIGPAGVG